MKYQTSNSASCKYSEEKGRIINPPQVDFILLLPRSSLNHVKALDHSAVSLRSVPRRSG